MLYFGGGGVKGALHPSLTAWIDCFDSAPFPKMFPRGGGVWDQDPILMRDFRIIRTHELQWKQTQEQLSALRNKDPNANQGGAGPSSGNLEDLLNEYIDDSGESPVF